MECIYAIALYASQASQFMNRIAIVSTGTSYPYARYALYQAPHINHVPHPASKSAHLFPHFPATGGASLIIMTRDYHDRPNTYVAVYCSFKLSRAEMEAKIVRGLLPITPASPHLSRDNTEAEKRCLAYITRVSQERRASLVSSSELIAWPDCSERIIASLAYQNKISVVGQYREFGPPYFCGPCARVNADAAFQMRNLISDDQFFVVDDASPQPSALAWYQGHLHVFVRSRRGNSWRPLTKLSREERNAEKIIQWLEDSGILTPYLRFVEKYKEMISFLDEYSPHSLDDHELYCVAHEIFAKRFSMIKIRNLVPSDVTGEIGQHFDVPSMFGS